MRHLALIVGFVAVGCGNRTPVVEMAPGFTLVVAGATSSACTVKGAFDRELGSGPPSSVTFALPSGSAEEMAIVRCADLAAPFVIGDRRATLTQTTTRIANYLSGRSLRKGTRSIAEAMVWLAGREADGPVMQSLADFVTAFDATINPGRRTTAVGVSVSDVIKLLVNLGQPVLVEQVGPGKTIDSCTTAAVAALSTSAVAVDAAVVGSSGCLVYVPLYAITDLNDPLFTPDNIPASFRSVATESGVVAALAGSAATHSLASLRDLLFSTLGYTAYSEDDEGVITPQTISLGALASFSATLGGILAGAGATDGQCGSGKVYVCHLPPGNPNNAHTLCIGEPALTTHLGHGDSPGPCGGQSALSYLQSFRFHTGYNPSGGWEVDVAAARGPVPPACVDSNPATPCSMEPLHFDFDGVQVTAAAGGPFALQLEYRGGGFESFAWIVNLMTSKYYRDSLFHRVKVPIDPTGYSAIDYRNVLYDSCLDPMTQNGIYGAQCTDGVGTVASAPYSDAAFRKLYPNMTLVENAYLLPSPEMVARLALLLADLPTGADLTTLQAFAMLKLFTQGMAAIPIDSNIHAILNDHGKTAVMWDAAVAAWLNASN